MSFRFAESIHTVSSHATRVALLAAFVVTASAARAHAQDIPAWWNWDNCETHDSHRNVSYNTRPLVADSRLFGHACPPLPAFGGARGVLGITPTIEIIDKEDVTGSCNIESKYSRIGKIEVELCGLLFTGMMREKRTQSTVGCLACIAPTVLDGSWDPWSPLPFSCDGPLSHQDTTTVTKEVTAGVSLQWAIPGFSNLFSVALKGGIGWRSDESYRSGNQNASHCAAPGTPVDSCTTEMHAGGGVGNLQGQGNFTLGRLFQATVLVTLNQTGQITYTSQLGARDRVEGANPNCPTRSALGGRYLAQLCFSWRVGVSSTGVGTTHGANLSCPFRVQLPEAPTSD